jgi:predicted aspartyl protease
MKICDQLCSCLLDTGCELTVLPARLVDKRDIKPTTQRILAANGSDIPVEGTVRVMAQVGHTKFPIEGLVSEHVFEPMIGIEWLEANQAVWLFGKGAVKIHGETLKLSARPRGQTWVRRVMVYDDTEIPPRSEFDVPTGVQFRNPSAMWPTVPTQWATERRELRPGVFVSGTVVPEDTATAYVRVANVNDQSVQLKKGQVLAELEPVAVLPPPDPALSATPTHIADMLKKIDPSVPDSCKRQLEALLNKYAHAFSANELDLGWTDLVKHTIDVGDSRPVRQALRKVPITQRSVIDKHIDEQLRQGIIQPSRSPFAANLVIVKKSDGSTRCCCDYRGLNLVTKRDAYPLPRIDQCLDALGGGRNSWFTCLDLRSGFFQVAMSEKDMDKTAFICHRGLFEHKTLPMGLKNSPATFQRLMDLTLDGLLFETCLAYLDDVILFSATLDEHLQRLEAVLQRLVATGLKLKPSKCRLLQKKVVFLGHVVSGDGVATDPSKTEQVAGWPVPSSVREVRGFLGLCGYYRRFIDRYAEIASPLTSLLKKGLRFHWSNDCQTAFERLKCALITPPILAMPRDEGRYVLDTDAANQSIGAVLSQMQDGQERVIAYASRVLNPAQKRYCVTRRELLAIVTFVHSFRDYLLGNRFLLRTDNAALTWLKRQKNPSGKVPDGWNSWRSTILKSFTVPAPAIQTRTLYPVIPAISRPRAQPANRKSMGTRQTSVR